MDLFVANTNNENNYLYRNNGNGNSWINILCVGTVSNRSAIGARIRARATIGGVPVWQLRELEGQTGFRGQNSLNVEFGFGDATAFDSLLVRWPSGITDTLTKIGINQFITITEGQVTPSVNQGNNGLRHEFNLKQNYPNPFNPSTTIEYSVPHAGHVVLKVYNALGQEVATLVDEDQEAGGHEVQFNSKGKATGAYFYRLQASGRIETRKFVPMR